MFTTGTKWARREGEAMTDMTKLLLQSSLGAELSESQAATLGELMQSSKLDDGQYLISEGTADDTLHVLLEGKLEVVKSAGGDEEVSLAVLRDGDLDMRMDSSVGETAAQWLARVEEADLVKVLFELGEEKFARRISRAIIQTRDETELNSTLQLANIVAAVTPKKLNPLSASSN